MPSLITRSIFLDPDVRELSRERCTSIVMMCARDIQPFSIIEGEGFRGFVETILSIGAKHGNVSVDDVLPNARIVSCHLHTATERMRDELKNTLMKEDWFAVKTDLWTHEQTTTPYITLMVHYIDMEWKLCSMILATRSMEERHTAENIQTTTMKSLQEMNAYQPNNVYMRM